VVLERASGPFIETQVGGGDADLPGDELHRVVGQLRSPAREPASTVVDQLVQVHQHHRAFVIRA
jgi:hypothetical protein